MRKIIYYVAVSIDGFIEGPGNSTDMFLHEQSVVDHYMKDLLDFDTAIMGRKTYEYGYRFGLKPGDAAYPHMQHYIFSNSLRFENSSENVHVVDRDIELVKALKYKDGKDIYLCGGGTFAGWLLDHKMVDVLKIKLNPILLGGGIRLFGSSKGSHFLSLFDAFNFDNGFKIMSYNVKYE
jgi:dihydrofolate reductase